jgi:phage shock protein PspC (stress-responsive transcriptional regulator)
VLGGVCAGIARSAGLDPLLLRIAVVAVTVLTGGAGVPAYLAAWVLIPREPLDAAPLPSGADRPGPPLHAVGSDAPGEAVGPAARPDGPDVRAAWTAVSNDLRSLTTELRRAPAAPDPAPEGHGNATAASTTGTGMPDGEATTDAEPAAEPAAGAIPPPRSPLAAADDAATALGDRLRTPEVQEGARRAASSVTQAVAASVDELARRVRRDRS